MAAAAAGAGAAPTLCRTLLIGSSQTSNRDEIVAKWMSLLPRSERAKMLDLDGSCWPITAKPAVLDEQMRKDGLTRLYILTEFDIEPGDDAAFHVIWRLNEHKGWTRIKPDPDAPASAAASASAPRRLEESMPIERTVRPRSRSRSRSPPAAIAAAAAVDARPRNRSASPRAHDHSDKDEKRPSESQQVEEWLVQHFPFPSDMRNPEFKRWQMGRLAAALPAQTFAALRSELSFIKSLADNDKRITAVERRAGFALSNDKRKHLVTALDARDSR
jgi:hypothetical protein